MTKKLGHGQPCFCDDSRLVMWECPQHSSNSNNFSDFLGTFFALFLLEILVKANEFCLAEISLFPTFI